MLEKWCERECKVLWCRVFTQNNRASRFEKGNKSDRLGLRVVFYFIKLWHFFSLRCCCNVMSETVEIKRNKQESMTCKLWAPYLHYGRFLCRNCKINDSEHECCSNIMSHRGRLLHQGKIQAKIDRHVTWGTTLQWSCRMSKATKGCVSSVFYNTS